MNWELIGISGYVLMMLIIGWYVSRRIKTDDDYFLAGRSLGPWLATFSIFATWFGAETCIGTSGQVYQWGLAGIRADPLAYTICILVFGLVFSQVLWRRGVTTLPELYRHRYSPNVERLAAIIMIPSSLVWAGAQVRAFGQIIHATTDYGAIIGVTVAAAVVIVYTMSGGLLADAYTDLIQGIALVGGLGFMAWTLVSNAGGPTDFWSAVPADKLQLFAAGEEMSTWARAETWLVPILGSVMAQELVSRVVASRSPEIARSSSLKAAAIYLFVGLMPVTVGLLGAFEIPGLEDPETLMPLMAKKHLGTIGYVVFVGALVSAILSTVDTTLLAVSALATHNLVYPSFPKLDEKHKVRLARGFTLVSGVIAYLIAFSSESVSGLVETASSLGGPTILVLTCFALFSKLGNATSAMAAILASLGTWFLGHFIWEWDAPVLATVVVGLLAYLATVPFSREGALP